MINPELMDIPACYQAMGFSDPPFSITPDTGYFYPGSHHLAALTHLREGMTNAGFTLLTGEVGLGKTLLCRWMLRHPPAGVRTAYIYNPPQSYDGLLRSILNDLTGASPQTDSVDELLRLINEELIQLTKNGERAAVLVDEAHRLSPELLEGLRLLSNLETEKSKLLHLLLIGQPELQRTLARRELRPLSQRIAIRKQLRPLEHRQTAEYIQHRLNISRHHGYFRFQPLACRLIHLFSKGVPRRINLICDRAMMAAFAAERMDVSAAMTLRAVRDIAGKT